MKPYVCKRHGPQDDPYICTSKSPKRKALYRMCRTCRAEASLKNCRAASRRGWFSQWYVDNKERVSARGRYRRARDKAAIIAGYGGRCACCGETRPEFLSIDHIYGDGSVERRTTKKGLKLYRWLIENNFPRDRYRLLCMNCNFSHGKFGYCPHMQQLPVADTQFEMWGH